ncbi:hypothetical protein Ddc_18349 [Ditylenchus destructor]|nr:hypothetical protein Ddc_18349 [Ditylenchus destructor]
MRPVIFAQNHNTVNSSVLLNKLNVKSTTYETPTSTYFEVRSEHLYRRVLNPNIEKMLMDQRPYKYIIVPVINSRDEIDEYKTAQETLECYAALHKYAYKVLYADGSDEYSRQSVVGPSVTNCLDTSPKSVSERIMFRRHCVFAQFMKNNPQHEWFLFLDADIGVINPDKRLEDFAPSLLDIEVSADIEDLIFYNRIFNFQIAAGSYMARNTVFSYNFLMEWSDFLSRFPGSFIGRDNGVLHIIIV